MLGEALKQVSHMTWYEELPKIELHVHLEGAIPHTALFNLIQKYGGDPSVPDVAALAKRFKYKDFPQFIETWIWIILLKMKFQLSFAPCLMSAQELLTASGSTQFGNTLNMD
jgi:hypothetical protein